MNGPGISPPDGPSRIVYYSHDALGLGHIRRNLAIATTLAERFHNPAQLLLAGVPQAAALTRPEGCDVTVIPSLAKNDSGEYAPRYLPISLADATTLRTAILDAALTGFSPELFIVDKHPLGFGGELHTALRRLRATGQCRLVLGLRDVLDSPDRTRRDWDQDATTEIIDEFYDEVWIYGDPAIHDLTEALDLPATIRAKMKYVGYLAEGRGSAIIDTPCHPHPQAPYVLGMVGGGADGIDLALAFAQHSTPSGLDKVLICGPQMSARSRSMLHSISRNDPRLTVIDDVTESHHWMANAVGLISMGGYNTICEALALKLPLLVVPRVHPRAEQLVRAAALQEAGLVEMIHPAELSPHRLSTWVHALGQPDRNGADLTDPSTTPPVNLNGLAQLADRVASLSSKPRYELRQTTREVDNVSR